MAKINPRQLFVDAFKDFNLVRYANSRVDKPRFQGLQLSELTFGVPTVEEGTHKITFDLISSDSRRFNAVNQSFIKANIGDVGISEVLSTDYPYEDVTTMKALSEPGLAAYMNADQTKVLTAVVFSEANLGTIEEITDEVQLLLIAACKYTLAPEKITVKTTSDPKIWEVVLDCETIEADIIAVRSEMPVLDIPVTDYGPLAEELPVPNPYPPVENPPTPQ